ncbi:MAG: GTPase Era [Spirochaetaceae bacterium]|jgi:GTP-binding protein Era|nr:GTPase Era [Spirochaetaceae bacterium]
MCNTKKSAFVAIVGRPSAGKSTLLNALCGGKAAIVSPVPQTTRNSIRGIVNREQGQLVFVDTPGIHISERKLNIRLKAVAERTLGDSDLIVYVLDAARAPHEEEEAIAERLASLPEKTLSEKTVALVNKMDKAQADYAAIETFLHEKLPALPSDRIFAVSANKKTGLESVLDCLYALAPEGPPYYDAEFYTDQDVRFRITEIIREKCLLFLKKELPHCIRVDIENMSLENEEGKEILSVMAVIRTERDSQKGIVVGKGGAMVRKIRLAALEDLKELFDWEMALEIWVKTDKDWRHNDKILRRLV